MDQNRFSEEKTSLILEEMEIGIFSIDLHTETFQFFNPVFQKMVRPDSQPFSTNPFFYLIGCREDQKNLARQFHESLLVSGEGEVSLLMNFGTSPEGLFQINARLNENRNLIGTIKPISFPQQCQWQSPKDHLLSLAGTLPDIAYIFDLEAKHTIYISQEIGVLLGYSKEEIQAMGQRVFIQLLHPLDLNQKTENLKRFSTMKDQEVLTTEFRMKRKEGHYIWLRSREKVFKRSLQQIPIQIFGLIEDITSQKEAEEALKKSEEKLEMFFRQSLDGFFFMMMEEPIVWDEHTDKEKTLDYVFSHQRITKVNQAMLNQYGATEKNFLGLTPSDFFARHLEHGRKVWRQFFDQGKLHISTQEQKLDGTSIWIEGDYICIYDEQRRISGHFGIQRDITQKKFQEERIQHNLIHQSLLAEIAQLLNNLGEFQTSINRSLRLLGEHTQSSRVYTFEDHDDGLSTNNTFEWCSSGITSQKDSLQNIPYDIIPSFKPMLIQKGMIRASKVSDLPIDLKEILEAQEIRSVLILPLLTSEKFIGFIGFDQCIQERDWNEEDVTLLKTIANVLSNAYARKNILIKMKENETRLRLALQAGREGLWDWNIQTGEVFFDRNWAEMLDYTQEEIEPTFTAWSSLVHAEDLPSAINALNLHLQGETPFYESTCRLKTKHGQWRWILDHGQVVERDSTGNPLRAVGTHINVDYQKKMELQFKELSLAKDRFLSIIGHDLKNPLHTILGFSELLKGEIRVLSPDEIREYSMLIHKIAKKTSQLLENLLTWALSQRNRVELDRQHFNLWATVSDTLELLKQQAREKEIEITADSPEEMMVFADSRMIQTVFRNLVSNAIKFTPRKGKIHIQISHKDETKVQCAVKDNGVGINRESLLSLFQIDSGILTSGTENETGTGLGLILSKDFIEKNKGVIYAESEEGKGSTFTFEIPVG